MSLENCKTLMKATEDNTNRCKDLPRSWIGRVITVTMTELPRLPTDPMPSVSNHQRHFFLTELEQKDSFNLYENTKEPGSQKQS